MKKQHSIEKRYLRVAFRFMVILPFFLGLLLIGVRILGYLTTELKNESTLGSLYDNENRNEFKSQKTLLFMGIDRGIDADSEFVDFLALVSVDDSDEIFRVFNISPKFAPYIQERDEYISFKSLLVYLKTYYPLENSIDRYIEEVEKVMAINIDGYVYVTKDGIDDYANIIGSIKISSPSEVEDDDLPGFVINKGDNYLMGDRLVDFVSLDQNGDNDRLQRQLSAVQSLANNIKTFKLFFYQTKFSKLINSEVRSSLNMFDIAKLFYKIKFQNYKFQVGYTNADNAIRVKNELDERWYTVFNTLDKDIQKIFINEKVKREQAKVDIFNATNTSGLARNRSRRLENQGLRIVLVGNTNQKYEKTTVYLNSQNDYSNTLEEIYNTLDSNEIEILNEKYEGRSVGDIVIVLGNNELN